MRARGGQRGGFRALRAVAVGGVVAVALAGAVAAAVVAHFARTVVTPPRSRRDDVRIFGLHTLALPDGAEAQCVVLGAVPDTVVDGRYGLWFSADTGHARLGEIVARTENTVTRRLLQWDFGDLAAAEHGRWGAWFHLGPWEFELPYENVTIRTALGPAPAWWVPSSTPSARWVIQVHGRAVRRQEGLRAVPVFHEAGLNSLLISYRNDGEAPESRDGRYGLGDTEWPDVEAAMQFAREHGAREIVLMGWSMGGAIAMQAALRAEDRELVRGIVLDSPALDWRDVLMFQGAGYRLPPAINDAVIQTIGSTWGRAVTGLDAPIDFTRLNMAERAHAVEVPVLLMHSVDDGFVPVAGSRALARARPDIVRYEEFTEARHTKLWNYDPDRWNDAIRSWLAALDWDRLPPAVPAAVPGG